MVYLEVVHYHGSVTPALSRTLALLPLAHTCQCKDGGHGTKKGRIVVDAFITKGITM